MSLAKVCPFVVLLAVLFNGCSDSDSVNPGAPADGEIQRFLEANPEMATPEIEPSIRKEVED